MKSELIVAGSLGLVVIEQAVVFLAAIVRGGFKIGSLARTVEQAVAEADQAAFLAGVAQRLVQLGFRPTGVVGEYVQGGGQPTDHTSFPHAKTAKRLNLEHERGRRCAIRSPATY